MARFRRQRRRGPPGPSRRRERWNCACTGSTTPPRRPCSTWRPRASHSSRATRSGSFWVPTEQARQRRGARPPRSRSARHPPRGLLLGRDGAHHPDRFGREPGRSSRRRGDQSRLCADPAVLLGNAAQWTRRLTQAVDSPGRQVWTAITSGLTRLFGFVLTLLFTTTAATLALDIGAAQCAAQPTLCGPLQWLFEPMAAVEPRPAPRPVGPAAGRRGLGAVGALVDVTAALRPAAGDAARRLRHDRRRARTPTARAAPAADRAAVGASRRLSQPGFLVEPDHAPPRARAPGRRAPADRGASSPRRPRWRGGPTAAALIDAACLGGATGEGWFVFFAVAAILALAGLLCAAVLTSGPAHHARGPRGGARAAAGPTSPPASSSGSRWSSFGGVCAFVVFAPAPAVDVDRLYGGGMTPCSSSRRARPSPCAGVFFRPWAQRRRTAWFGCGPAVFMTVALGVAVGTSSIVLVAIGDFAQRLAGSGGAPRLERLARWRTGPADLLAATSRSALSWWSCVLVALALVLVTGAPATPHDDGARGSLAHRPGDRARDAGGHPDPGGRRAASVSDRAAVAHRRQAASRLAPASGRARRRVALGGAARWRSSSASSWTVWAYSAGTHAVGHRACRTDSSSSWMPSAWGCCCWPLWRRRSSRCSPSAPPPARAPGRSGIVWDIACFLPQTGHPFGPPCYAERAVPEIAGRINHWLRTEDRRVVLAAHSMGAVLAMSTIGLLASSDATRRLLPRVAVLTFGVQLRPFFGRMLPELLGPEVLGTDPLESPPGLLSADPWRSDFAAQSRGIDDSRRRRRRTSSDRSDQRLAGARVGARQRRPGAMGQPLAAHRLPGLPRAEHRQVRQRRQDRQPGRSLSRPNSTRPATW